MPSATARLSCHSTAAGTNTPVSSLTSLSSREDHTHSCPPKSRSSEDKVPRAPGQTQEGPPREAASSRRLGAGRLDEHLASMRGLDSPL